MKTPEEIVQEFADSQYCLWNGHEVIDALEAAGYAIVPKELSEDRRVAFNRFLNLHPDDYYSRAAWPDLVNFMSKP